MKLKSSEPRRFNLGPFQVDSPFILAPMAGITNSPYRRIMRERGSAIVVSELVSANGIEYGGQRTLDLLRFDESERTVGLQIFGEDVENLVKACIKVEEMGADFVDLNLGCPVPKVVKKGAGSAMCRNPVQLGKTLEQMVKSVQIPVSIKIRTGWDANSVNLHDVISAATDAGVVWVAIHGRTRAQGYSGLADWDLIGEAKVRASLPIIGNGDVVTAEQAVKRYRDYGVDGVMIGRGALRNPFIFEQAECLLRDENPKVAAIEDYMKLMSDHRAYLEECFDQNRVGLHLRKFLSWYASGYPHCHEFRRLVFSKISLSELWDEAIRFFESSVGRRDDKYLSQPFLMGGHG